MTDGVAERGPDAEPDSVIDTLIACQEALERREGGLVGVLRKAGLPIGEGLAERLALVEGEGGAPNGSEEACRLAERAMSDAGEGGGRRLARS
ncbi:MAG: hypothetical protein RIB45_14115 [Marivibrio sp.]|uniref:hypothetical protein n=1 Tax=Marivibrio sp. TaxID=2039719 RepID=UPI0032F0640A